MGEACFSNKDFTKADYYKNLAKDNLLEADASLREFIQGGTCLDISMPADLEKLVDHDYSDLEDSSLLSKHKKSSKKVQSLEILKEDFDKFLDEVQNENKISLNKQDCLLKSKYFRIDALGGSRADWTLQLQDNTGKKYKYNSRIFAIVSISQDVKKVKGAELAQRFKDAMDVNKENREALWLVPEPELEVIQHYNKETDKEKRGREHQMKEESSYQDIQDQNSESSQSQ